MRLRASAHTPSCSRPGPRVRSQVALLLRLGGPSAGRACRPFPPLDGDADHTASIARVGRTAFSVSGEPRPRGVGERCRGVGPLGSAGHWGGQDDIDVLEHPGTFDPRAARTLQGRAALGPAGRTGARWRPAAGESWTASTLRHTVEIGSCTWCRCPAPDRFAGRRRLGQREVLLKDRRPVTVGMPVGQHGAHTLTQASGRRRTNQALSWSTGAPSGPGPNRPAARGGQSRSSRSGRPRSRNAGMDIRVGDPGWHGAASGRWLSARSMPVGVRRLVMARMTPARPSTTEIVRMSRTRVGSASVDGASRQHRVAVTQVLGHVLAQIVTDLVGVPAGHSDRRCCIPYGGIAGLFGQGPAVPARQLGQQSLQQRPHPPLRVHPREPAATRPIRSSNINRHRWGSRLAFLATARSSLIVTNSDDPAMASCPVVREPRLTTGRGPAYAAQNSFPSGSCMIHQCPAGLLSTSRTRVAPSSSSRTARLSKAAGLTVDVDVQAVLAGLALGHVLE